MAMDTEPISINREDIPGHLSEFRETTDKLPVLLDAKKGLWVDLGVPTVKGDTSEYIDPPNTPHVFMVHDLWLTDQDHKDVLVKDVPVIFAHGYRDRNTWKFANGQPVVDTVEAFDRYAEENGLPKLELVIACNRDPGPNPLGIKIKDFTKERPIVQVVGEVVIMKRHSSAFSEKGKVAMEIETGEFWGLDNLLVAKQVEIIK